MDHWPTLVIAREHYLPRSEPDTRTDARGVGFRALQGDFPDNWCYLFSEDASALPCPTSGVGDSHQRFFVPLLVSKLERWLRMTRGPRTGVNPGQVAAHE